MQEEQRGQEHPRAAFEGSWLPRLRTLSRGWASPIYVVGGMVRDWVGGGRLGERDIDLASRGEVHLLAERAAALLGGRPFALDESTWRVIFREGRERWQLDIAGLRGGTIESDLRERDFTINAMALEISEAALVPHDPLLGGADLASRCIRWCNTRCFRDDPLRLLRAIRFQAQLGFFIEEETLEGMRRATPLLGTVARERIRDEFFRILAQPGSAYHIKTLKDLVLLPAVIPGIGDLEEVGQGYRHHLPLWEHSLETLQGLEGLIQNLARITPQRSSYLQGHLSGELEGEITPSLVLKFVALLHDIGKPASKTVDETGRIRFLGHEEEGRSRISQICRSLRLGKRVRDRAAALVGSHLRPILLASEPHLTRRAKYRFFRDLGELGIDLLLLGWADLRATVGEDDTQLKHYQSFYAEMLEYFIKDYMSMEQAPLIRGSDLIRAFGLLPGPLIGLLLKRIQEAQAEGRFATRDEGLRFLKSRLEDWIEGEKTD
jgi:poly(A) polymerase